MAVSKTKSVQVLNLQSKTTFVDSNGKTRDIKEPEGQPSDKQLWLLWKNGRLAILAKPGEQAVRGPQGRARAGHAAAFPQPVTESPPGNVGAAGRGRRPGGRRRRDEGPPDCPRAERARGANGARPPRSCRL